MSALSEPAEARIAYSIPNAAWAVDMGIEAFRTHIAAGNLTVRYPNSSPRIAHDELVEWFKNLPLDKPLPK